jgi:hypothetical protein
MERNEFAVAGGMVLILCSTLIISLVLSSSAAKDWAAWAQAIGTVGAIIAAVVIPQIERRKIREHDQTIAAMRVAAQLRSWLGPCASSVADVINGINSRGVIGRKHLEIPALGIEMNDVATMRIETAKLIYSIVEQRYRAVDKVTGAIDLDEIEDAQIVFFNESARLFRRVRKLYRDLAPELGLHPSTCQRWELDTINDAARRGNVRNWQDLKGKKTPVS